MQIASTSNISLTQVLHHAASADAIAFGSGKSTDANSASRALCYLLSAGNAISSFNSDFKKHLPAFLFLKLKYDCDIKFHLPDSQAVRALL